MDPTKLKLALATIPGTELVEVTNSRHLQFFYKNARRPIVCSHGSNRTVSRKLLGKLKNQIEEQTGVGRPVLDEHFAQYM